MRTKSKKPFLTKKQIKMLEERLVKEKKKFIFSGIYRSEEFNLSNEDMSDEVDMANADMSNAQRLRSRNREVFYEKKINEALRRIKEGNYGLCIECEEPIRFSRLEARPTADLCIMCKEESERMESNNFIARQSKSLGKKVELVNHI